MYMKMTSFVERKEVRGGDLRAEDLGRGAVVLASVDRKAVMEG
jgi:hypothetical protein